MVKSCSGRRPCPRSENICKYKNLCKSTHNSPLQIYLRRNPQIDIHVKALWWDINGRAVPPKPCPAKPASRFPCVPAIPDTFSLRGWRRTSTAIFCTSSFMMRSRYICWKRFSVSVIPWYFFGSGQRAFPRNVISWARRFFSDFCGKYFAADANEVYQVKCFLEIVVSFLSQKISFTAI